jgi:O-antigen/teichoic acid export membrane protein
VHLGLERAERVAHGRVLGELVALALVLLLVREPSDVVWVPVAQLVGDTVCAVYLHGLLFLKEEIRLTLRLDAVARPLVRPGGYLVLSAVLGLMIYNADWVLLRLFDNATVLGYYAAAYGMVSFFANLGGTYGANLLPVLTRSGREGPEKQLATYHSAAAHVFALGLPVAIGGSLVADQIIATVFGADFAPAAPVLSILIWTFPLALFRDTALMGLMSRGLEGRVLRLTGWAALLNMALNLVLIPVWGMTGAAIATVAGEGGRMAIAIVYARREGFHFVGIRRLWRPLLAGCVMAALLLPLPTPALWLAVPLGIGSYAGILYLLGGIRVKRGSLPALSV